MVSQHTLRRDLTSVEVLAENQLVGLRQYFECTQVKYLMVQRAHCDAIGHFVRTIGLKPLDVRSFQSNGLHAPCAGRAHKLHIGIGMPATPWREKRGHADAADL